MREASQTEEDPRRNPTIKEDVNPSTLFLPATHGTANLVPKLIVLPFKKFIVKTKGWAHAFSLEPIENTREV